jgi:hypothetical protein
MRDELAVEESLRIAANAVPNSTKAQLAEQVQVFLRELALKDIGWISKAAVRTVHGLVTKYRKANGL